MASSFVSSTLGAGLVVGSVFAVGSLVTATDDSDAGMPDGLVFQDSVVVTQSGGAYTATKNVTVCFDPDCGGSDDDDDGDTLEAQGGHPSVDVRYTAEGHDSSLNDQLPYSWYVEDFTEAPLPEVVYILVTRQAEGQGDVLFAGTVVAGDTFPVDASARTLAPTFGPKGLNAVETFGQPSNPRAGAGGKVPTNQVQGLGQAIHIGIYDQMGGTLLQQIQVDTSGHQPLKKGDRFGSALVVDLATDDDDDINRGDAGCDIFPNDGLFTYAYEICNDGSSPLGLIAYEVVIPASAVVSAGFLCNGGGAAPSATTIEVNRVEWDFFIDPIDPGECSCTLFITSPLGPDLVGASVSGMAGLDTPTECAGPAVICEFCPDGGSDDDDDSDGVTSLDDDDSGNGPCFFCETGLAVGPPCNTNDDDEPDDDGDAAYMGGGHR